MCHDKYLHMSCRDTSHHKFKTIKYQSVAKDFPGRNNLTAKIIKYYFGIGIDRRILFKHWRLNY